MVFPTVNKADLLDTDNFQIWLIMKDMGKNTIILFGNLSACL